MIQGAKLQAIIDLLGEIDVFPANKRVNQYFRSRRYIGSKDRKEISMIAFDILRKQASLDWGLKKPTSRLRIMRYLMESQHKKIEEIGQDFSGKNYCPELITASERKALKGALANKTPIPPWVKANVPEWIYDRLAQSFKEDLNPLLGSLNEQACLDVRVNTLKISRKEALEKLKEQGITMKATPYSDLGLRGPRGQPLSATPLFQQGAVEVQDEGSQIVAALVNAQPKMTVLDLCAGGGGKTLALACSMENSGRLVATDISESRLKQAKLRLRRAGVDNTECRVLESKWLKRQNKKFDRVLVDAPCSGTGTWRRHPDLKWRFSEQDITDLCQKQREILTVAHSLVKPGGRLIYITCSLLPEENECQKNWFLKKFPEFVDFNIRDNFPEFKDFAYRGALQLLPHKHRTDGFYACVMVKSEKGSYGDELVL